jgi:hypothetical protein
MPAPSLMSGFPIAALGLRSPAQRNGVKGQTVYCPDFVAIRILPLIFEMRGESSG